MWANAVFEDLDAHLRRAGPGFTAATKDRRKHAGWAAYVPRQIRNEWKMAKKARDITGEILQGLREIKRGEFGRVMVTAAFGAMV
jgi:hypothetical protein